MLERVAAILKERCLVAGGRPLLVGVSGGPDSLCLWRLLSQMDTPLIVAHFNHGLRPEADREAAYVASLARQAGQLYRAGKGDVRAFARRQRLSIEEAAREMRYRFLFSVAEKAGAQAVVVGHQADDQVETVLMHLLRGAGSSGLSGMRFRLCPNPWSQTIPLVRPLLSTWREEIEAYLGENGMAPVWDASNRDETYFRNRLRAELIPSLETYNPQVKLALWRTADILGAESEALEAILQPAWEATLAAASPGVVGFHRQAFTAQPLGLQRLLLRKGLEQLLGGLRDVEYRDFERALSSLAKPSGSRREDLAGGVYMLVDGDAWIWLRMGDSPLPGFDFPQLRGAEPQTLPVPGEARLAGPWRLTSELLEATPELLDQALRNADPRQAWLNAEGISFPLAVRARLPGEHFQPLGMPAGTTSLADFMVNQKIPRWLRSTWPLVCSPEGPLWVVTLRIDHRFRLQEAGQRVLHLCVYRHD
ncbi:MAG: tRNA lysidine(34) synthetase TilS [Anaerolineales bacterium]|nr:tRNA lysidine(34) synthetase TilS [Anaerolineales bacterium]